MSDDQCEYTLMARDSGRKLRRERGRKGLGPVVKVGLIDSE